MKMDKRTGIQRDKASGALPASHALYAPGLKWRTRVGADVPMWIPPGKDVRAGYLPKSLMLDRDSSQIELAETCRAQWKDLESWRTGTPKADRHTIAWLIARYQTDETSPYHALDPDTQKSYGWECKRIRETVGERRLEPKKEGGIDVPRLTGVDFRRWFHNWGHPPPREVIKADGSIEVVAQKPTPSRATHCMAMLRTLISYYVEIGGAGAVQLRATLSSMRFKKSGARTVAPDYGQVDAIVNKALEMGYRSIAITTLAQYELIERRKHIIGRCVGQDWSRGWVWDGEIMLDRKLHKVGVTADWRIIYYQTKKGANLRDFDLKPVQRLLGLMQETPKEQRMGSIIVCEDTGQPWKLRRYQEAFRKIADAAGVPASIFSMDMRSGGVTEADNIEEITPRMIQDGAGHANIQTQEIYRRGKQRNANKVVVLRQAARNRP
jgi:hypothetical protein